MLAKMSDSSGETFVSAFNEQAEMLLGQSAESLATIRDQVRLNIFIPAHEAFLLCCNTTPKFVGDA